MKIKFILTGCLALISLFGNAQDRVWKNKKCAVSLTYDDALNVDLDHAIPALDSAGFKGTFYLSGYSQGLTNRIPEWRTAAANGHELGNHTLFHPCAGKPTGRSFVVPEYDLNNYTVKRIADEVKMTNALLKSVDGKTKRTFAYPCGDTDVNGVPYYDAIKSEFVAARGTRTEMLKINNMNMADVGCYLVNGQTGDQLISLVKKAMETNTLLVFLFHGVGGEHSLNVSRKAHSELVQFLKQNEKDIWVAPFMDIAEYAQSFDNTPKAVKPANKKQK
ncbi:polysaccharide deacetylase family protein [Adhaeribacter aquaticus]|uniref:polysaccharide deacetylase family protein n=1 Tax=Adhaeribacter aquaticus TaxID=299567 RepID=UPI00040BB4B2|nr:polysaccharide deacetylase family protein [Adhaeribacter aquaticus]